MGGPWLLRIGRLFEHRDPPVIGAAPRPFVLVRGGDHGIFVRTELAGGEAVPDVTGTYVVFRPVRYPGIAAPQPGIFVPEDVTGGTRAHEVWESIVTDSQHRDIVTDIRHV